MKIPLEHEELTGRIRQAAFETHCYFGNGFLEKIYENSLSRHLREIGLVALQQEPITIRDEAQVHHYLKATGLTLGLLINFGAEKLQFKRIIRTRK